MKYQTLRWLRSPSTLLLLTSGCRRHFCSCGMGIGCSKLWNTTKQLVERKESLWPQYESVFSNHWVWAHCLKVKECHWDFNLKNQEHQVWWNHFNKEERCSGPRQPACRSLSYNELIWLTGIAMVMRIHTWKYHSQVWTTACIATSIYWVCTRPQWMWEEYEGATEQWQILQSLWLYSAQMQL